MNNFIAFKWKITFVDFHKYLIIIVFMTSKLWSLYEEPKEEVKEVVVQERKVNYQTIVVTEICPDLHFFAQNVETGRI